MPEKNILFSIVVPVYNVEKYLAECLDSIIGQTEKMSAMVEVLLINDGSKDSSGVLCEKYAAEFPEIIRCFHKQNEGLLLARRYGFKRARGEYIVNCDSDDVMEANTLQKLKEAIEKNNRPDVILFNYNRYDGKDKEVACKNLFSNKDSAFNEETLSGESNAITYFISKEAVLTEFMHSHNVTSMWCKTFKKSCLELNLDYSSWGRLNTGEDTLQTIEIFDRANNFAYINKTLYNYRIGSGMTGKFDPHYYDTFRNIFMEIEKKKVVWNMINFDVLLSEKVLAMTGRAITQSRYNKWGGVSEHVDYLRKLRDDGMLQRSLLQIELVKRKLQQDHYILLKLMEHNCLVPIVFMLNIKNMQVNIFDR